jgi:hypothetical protein
VVLGTGTVPGVGGRGRLSTNTDPGSGSGYFPPFGFDLVPVDGGFGFCGFGFG